MAFLPLISLTCSKPRLLIPRKPPTDQAGAEPRGSLGALLRGPATPTGGRLCHSGSASPARTQQLRPRKFPTRWESEQPWPGGITVFVAPPPSIRLPLLKHACLCSSKAPPAKGRSRAEQQWGLGTIKLKGRSRAMNKTDQTKD